MPALTSPGGELVWAAAEALAWVIGEAAASLASLPRISAYALVGLALSHAQLGWLPRPSDSGMMVLHLHAVVQNGSDADLLRQIFVRTGSPEGMVEAAVRRFRSNGPA